MRVEAKTMPPTLVHPNTTILLTIKSGRKMGKKRMEMPIKMGDKTATAAMMGTEGINTRKRYFGDGRLLRKGLSAVSAVSIT
jgi:hypothetical protein